MKILIVSQVFFPENFKINNLVKYLISSGHELTIITGKPNYPEGKFYNNYGIFSKIKSDYFGAKVYRLPIIPRGNNSTFLLSLNYLSFAIVGSLFMMFYKKKFDFSFVFGVSPIISAFPAIIHKIFYKTKFYLWVLDLWPESVVVTKKVSSNTIIKILDFLVNIIYSFSDKIFISSEFMKNSIFKYQKFNKKFNLNYFPNWINESYLNIKVNKAKYKNLFNKEYFNIMLAGNIGYNIDYSNIINTAKELKNYKIIFNIVGSGSFENDFKLKVKENNLNDKIIFLGSFDSKEMPDMYYHSDLMLITLADEEIYSYTVPEKLQSYMVMKKPIVGMISGETQLVINNSECGLASNAGDFKSLAKNIYKLYNCSSAELKDYGLRGFNYAKKYFSLSKNIKTIIDQ